MKGSKDLVKVILQKKHILLFSRMKKKIRLSKHLRRKLISKSLAFNKSGSNEIIDMIIGFIDQKTKPINDTNNENENMQILDPVIQNHYGRLTKQTIEEGTHRNWIEL
ncbi:hypothetical protein C1646_750778 [Rhizophagus diaphanus]|nr:hypothetical protein C1646_750778 [Rhizophagus diaphanus] [Rhizophagus sp. MUCL 43196]